MDAGSLVYLLIWFSAPVVVACGWARWLRTSVRFESPKWRSVIAFAGMAILSFAIAATVGEMLYIRATGGLSGLGRIFPVSVDGSLWVSTFALLSSALGKDPQRWHIAFGSVVLLWFWVMVQASL